MNKDERTQNSIAEFLEQEMGIVLKEFDINIFFEEETDHKDQYTELINRAKAKDSNTRALMYILSCCHDLFVQADEFYDFKNKKIITNYRADITGAMGRLIALGFELYTDKPVIKDINNKDMNIVDIFGYLDYYLFNIAINAIRIRFNKMP